MLLIGWLGHTGARAQVICKRPTIAVRYACGGVVSLSISGDAPAGATFAWPLNNGSPATATGPGPITVIYPGGGPYTVTLLTTNSSGCQTTSRATVTPDQGASCCPTNIPVANLLGAVGTTTTLSGSRTFSGSYRVLGDLVLTNGTYALSRATFYVDGAASKTPLPGGGYQRTVSGSTITVGTNATLTLDQSTLTASGSSPSCPMWRGVVMSSINQGPAGTYRLEVKHGSTISHALCAIELNSDPVYSGTTAYNIDHAAFAHNLTDVYDYSGHVAPQASDITSCTFDSDPAQMHLPYNQTSAGDQYYTYQALCLTPAGSANANAIEVRDNTITQAVYGIVNTNPDQAGVLIQGNRLNKIFQTGIWTVNDDSNSGATTPTVRDNLVAMNIYPPLNTDQIDPNATLFGIVGERLLFYNAFANNTVAGDNTLQNGAMKPQIGLSIEGQTDATGNMLVHLTEAIRTTELDNSKIADNLIDSSTSGMVVELSPNGVYQLGSLGCNTFAWATPTANTYGLVVQQNATINDIGSSTSPAANRFDGVATKIYNDGSDFTYFQTNSSQEAVNFSNIGGGSNTSVYNVYLPTSALNNYCLNNGASNGNGINQARASAASSSYISALMDSVRQQLVPAARSRRYLYEVLSYHRDNQLLPALESWWNTLALPNTAAYRTVGRFLLRAYDQQASTATAAQRVLAGLQPAALLDTELAAQLRLRAVLRHLPQLAHGITAADSTTLRALAWSGTSAAASASRWLRYYYPRIPLPPQTAGPATSLVAPKTKVKLPDTGAQLGAAYPNPARGPVRIGCRLPAGGQEAELRLTNLLTGQRALVVPVLGVGRERSLQVDTQSLPAGQYACQLVVDGQLVAAPQKLIVNP